MKIRNGFVSNSSSSSFVVAVPSGRPLTSELVREALGLGKSATIFDDIVNIIAGAKPYKPKDIYEDYGYDSLEEAAREGIEAAHLVLSGWDIYTFRASSESSDPAELYLRYRRINIRNENIVINGEY